MRNPEAGRADLLKLSKQGTTGMPGGVTRYLTAHPASRPAPMTSGQRGRLH
jgi:hypothetical protein